MPIYAVIVLVALLGGGVSAAAQNALPGDALYGVKVNVNEKVAAGLGISTSADLAERRLEEAEKLAAKGELSAEAKAQIEENFAEHADRVEARVKEFEAREDFKAATDVTSNFETSLNAHEAILSRLAAKDSDAADVAEAVRVQAVAAGEQRAAAETRLFAPAALAPKAASLSTESAGSAQSTASDEALRLYAERRKDEALRLMREATEFIKNNRERINAEVVAKAEAQLRTANGYVVEGTAKLNAVAAADTTANPVMEAARLFQRAINVAHEALIILKAQASIGTEADVNLEAEIAPSSAGSVRVAGETETETEIGTEPEAHSGSSDERVGEIKPLVTDKVKESVKVNLGL